MSTSEASPSTASRREVAERTTAFHFEKALLDAAETDDIRAEAFFGY